MATRYLRQVVEWMEDHTPEQISEQREAAMCAIERLAGEIKEKGLDPEPFEVDVAQAICDLEANSNDLKAELHELYIVSAKEVDVAGRKAVVIFVPFKLLKVVHKIQSRLVREVRPRPLSPHPRRAWRLHGMDRNAPAGPPAAQQRCPVSSRSRRAHRAGGSRPLGPRRAQKARALPQCTECAPPS